MARFKEAEVAKIDLSEMGNHDADKLAVELRSEAEDNVKNKVYIKRNMRTVNQIERSIKEIKSHRPQSAWPMHKAGELPQYLINRRKQEEQEREEMKK